MTFNEFPVSDCVPGPAADSNPDQDWRRQVAIARVEGAYCVRAARPIAKGEVILHLDGLLTDLPSRFSVQIGVDRHVEIPIGTTLEEQLDRYPWRFLNHACEPSAVFRGRELIAHRAIERWEEISFDYTTAEFEMAAPFACRCGAKRCLGVVSGYLGLGAVERRRRHGRLAPHVLEAASEPS